MKPKTILRNQRGWVSGTTILVALIFLYLAVILLISDHIAGLGRAFHREPDLASKNLMALVQANSSRLFGPEDKQTAVVKRMLEQEQLAVYSKLEDSTVYVPLVAMSFLGRPLYLIEIHSTELVLFLEREDGQAPLSTVYQKSLDAMRCASEISVLPPPEVQTEFVYCE